MRRLLVLVVVMSVCGVSAGCQVARAGARCSTQEFGLDRTHVLQCRNGRWVRTMTASQGAHAVAAWFRVADGQAVDVAAGDAHTCALMASGRVKCWGDNSSGQLGDGTTTSSLHPVVVGGLTNAIAIVAGARHTCAVTDYRSAGIPESAAFDQRRNVLMCWGDNEFGQVRYDDPRTSVPHAVITITGLLVAPAASTPRTISAGGELSCATGLMEQRNAGYSESAWCSGTLPSINGPRRTSGNVTRPGWGTPAAGRGAICAGFAVTPSVECDGLGEDPAVPEPGVQFDFGAGNDVHLLRLGDDHVCAIVGQARAVSCAGAGLRGQLGQPVDAVPPDHPPAIVPGVVAARDVETGSFHTCASSGDGLVRCWGANDSGQLGDGTTTDRSTPQVVPGVTGVDGWVPVPVVAPRLPQSVVARVLGAGGPRVVGGLPDAPSIGVGIDAGSRHTCAVGQGHRVWCWGANDAGQLGDGTTERRLSAVQVVALA